MVDFWTDFYGSIFGKGGAGQNALQTQAATSGTMDNVLGFDGFNFGDIVAGFGSAKLAGGMADGKSFTFSMMPGASGPGASNPLPAGSMTATGDIVQADGTTAPAIDWGEWFARAATVILGFIFVAVGLSMFGRPVVAALK